MCLLVRCCISMIYVTVQKLEKALSVDEQRSLSAPLEFQATALAIAPVLPQGITSHCFPQNNEDFVLHRYEKMPSHGVSQAAFAPIFQGCFSQVAKDPRDVGLTKLLMIAQNATKCEYPRTRIPCPRKIRNIHSDVDGVRDPPDLQHNSPQARQAGGPDRNGTEDDRQRNADLDTKQKKVCNTI